VVAIAPQLEAEAQYYAAKQEQEQQPATPTQPQTVSWEEKDQRPGSYIMVGGKPVPDPLEARIAEEARKSGGINVIIPGSSSGEHLLYAQREAERLGGSVVVQTEKDFTSVKVEERGSSGQIFLDPKVTTAEDVLMYRAQYPEAKIYLTSAAEAFPVRQPVQETPALPETPEGFRWVPVSREGDTTTYSLRPEGEQWASGVDIEGLTEQQKAMFAGLPKSGKLFYTEDKGWYAETTASASESAPKNIFGLPYNPYNPWTGSEDVLGFAAEKVSLPQTHSTMVPLNMGYRPSATEGVYRWALDQPESSIQRNIGMAVAGAVGSGIESIWRPDVPNVFAAGVEQIASGLGAVTDKPHTEFLQSNPAYAAGAIGTEVALLAGPEIIRGAGYAERLIAGTRATQEGTGILSRIGKVASYGWSGPGTEKWVKVRYWDEASSVPFVRTAEGTGGTIGQASQVRSVTYGYEGTIRSRSWIRSPMDWASGKATPPRTKWVPESELHYVSADFNVAKDSAVAESVVVTPGKYTRVTAAEAGGRSVYIMESEELFPKSGTFTYTAQVIEEAPEVGWTGKLDIQPSGGGAKTPLKFAKPAGEAVAAEPSLAAAVPEAKAGTAVKGAGTAAKVEPLPVPVLGERMWGTVGRPYTVVEYELEGAEALRFGSAGGLPGGLSGVRAAAGAGAEGLGLMLPSSVSVGVSPAPAMVTGVAHGAFDFTGQQVRIGTVAGVAARQMDFDFTAQLRKVTPLESSVSGSITDVTGVSDFARIENFISLRPMQALRTPQMVRVDALPRVPRAAKTKMSFPKPGYSASFLSGTRGVKYVESVNPFPLDLIPESLRRLGL